MVPKWSGGTELVLFGTEMVCTECDLPRISAESVKITIDKCLVSYRIGVDLLKMQAKRLRMTLYIEPVYLLPEVKCLV